MKKLAVISLNMHRSKYALSPLPTNWCIVCCIYLVFLSDLTILRIPIPPPNITLDLVEGTSITVKWTPHPEHESFVVNYTDSYRMFVVRYKKYQSKRDNFTNVFILGWNQQANLSNLEEGTQYFIQVASARFALLIDSLDIINFIGNYSEPLIVTTGQGEYKVLTCQFTYDRNQYLVCNLIHLCTFGKYKFS